MFGRRRLALACAGVAAAVAFGVGASAATKSAPRPDIWGVWMGLTGAEGADPRFGNTPYPTVPGFTAWGAEQSRKEGTALTPGECNPWSPMGFMGATGLFPIQILQGPNLIVIHHEAIVQPRRVYTDGRKHPPADETIPTFLGHSIAHWEGQVLVIDTTETNGRARPMNGYVSGAVNSGVDTTPRLPASDQAHFTERLRLVGGGKYLEDEITVDDPKVYLKPWSVKHYWQRRSDIDLQEYVCDDNRRPEDEGQGKGR